MTVKKTSPTALLVGDSPSSTTGFARVMEKWAFALKDRGFDVHICAVHDSGDPSRFQKEFSIWHCVDESKGPERVIQAARGCQPDIIVLFSDVSVCGQWAAALSSVSTDQKIPIPVLCYFPVDGGGMVPGLIEWMQRDWFGAGLTVATYTNWGKKVFEDAARLLFVGRPYPFWECHVLGHAVDTSTFYPIDRAEARRRLGITESVGDSFVLLNANTNTPRKNLDATIAGFARFLSTTPEAADGGARLWMHCNPTGSWDIRAMMQRECMAVGVMDWERHLIISQDRGDELHAGSNEAMNLVYNAADAGISTSGGEGWGLASCEMAACKKPQIVMDYAAHSEIFPPGSAYFLSPVGFKTAPVHLQVHAVPDVNDVADAIQHCYRDHTSGFTMIAENGYKSATATTWETLQEQFYELCWGAMVKAGRGVTLT